MMVNYCSAAEGTPRLQTIEAEWSGMKYLPFTHTDPNFIRFLLKQHVNNMLFDRCANIKYIKVQLFIVRK